MGERRLTEAAVIKDRKTTGRTRDMDSVSRHLMPELKPPLRELTAEVETGLEEAAAVDLVKDPAVRMVEITMNLATL